MHLYSITFEEGRYWKIVASGDLSRNSTWLAHQEVLRLLTGVRDVRMVVDLRAVHGRPDIVMSILQAEVLTKQTGIYTHRIAVIDLVENEMWMKDEMLCLSNRGLPVRFFTADEDAARWLLT